MEYNETKIRLTAAKQGVITMKIEKLSDNQIRCTLNKNDLASREIKISELAYGTEKAKNLFRDMMQQASYEFGFEAENLPLMIEAIPMSSESIVLIITKVDDPEELDTRFSRFSPSYDGEGEEDYEADIDYNDYGYEAYEEDALNPSEEIDVTDFQKLSDIVEDVTTMNKTGSKDNSANIRIFSFTDFATIEQVASLIRELYYGENTLYKDTGKQRFYLVLRKSEHNAVDFNRICNTISEYGARIPFTKEREAFFQEHFTPMIKVSALQILADIL